MINSDKVRDKVQDKERFAAPGGALAYQHKPCFILCSCRNKETVPVFSKFLSIGKVNAALSFVCRAFMWIAFKINGIHDIPFLYRLSIAASGTATTKTSEDAKT